jgi:hypothetical protein
MCISDGNKINFGGVVKPPANVLPSGARGD